MEEKKLRSGFTTGTCAAGAAKAAALMLLEKKTADCVYVMTPAGKTAKLSLCDAKMEEGEAMCAVRKDAGDDPDVTDKAFIYASVTYIKDGESPQRCYRRGRICLTGGQGVGIVTRPGLPCPVGMYAVNPVPRKMIFDEVETTARKAGYEGRLLVTIWIPEGEKLAFGTFNPRLGIEGGLSVLGTSGIVEPMSEASLRATIRLELHMKAVAGQRGVILTPGNYGESFLRETLGLSLAQGVQCSNFIEDSVKMAGDEGIKAILLAGHLGKLIKVAAGVGNTHSKYGDRRMEILWDCARIHCKGLLGDDQCRLKKQVLASNTTEEAVLYLSGAGIRKAVMEDAAERMRRQIEAWCGRGMCAGVVTFTNRYGILGMSRNAAAMIAAFRSREERIVKTGRQEARICKQETEKEQEKR